ncbi:MAG: hypothetical protein KC416_11775, partial [Myxococcales bacterium]|nr:hypothetical protein [Myxococcales bacterium]
MMIRTPLLLSTLALSACFGPVGEDIATSESGLGGAPIATTVVPASEIPTASPIDGANPFWAQMDGIFGKGFGVRLERQGGEAAYVHNPFRTESDASIFYFRVPYAAAVEYLGDRYDADGNELFPQPLKVVDLSTRAEWAVASLWFVDYRETDLGEHGNDSQGAYQEMVLTFVGAGATGPTSVPDFGAMSTAALALSTRFQTITARLVLNNQTAVDLGREFMGFDKTLGDVSIAGTTVSVSAEGRSIISNLKLPSPSTYANTKAQGELALRVINYDGWDAGQAMLGKTASRVFLEELEKGAIRQFKPTIRDWRDAIAADRTAGTSTLPAFD